MMKTKLIRPTPQEDAAITRGIAADPDTMEMSDEEFAAAVASQRGHTLADVQDDGDDAASGHDDLPRGRTGER